MIISSECGVIYDLVFHFYGDYSLRKFQPYILAKMQTLSNEKVIIMPLSM